MLKRIAIGKRLGLGFGLVALIFLGAVVALDSRYGDAILIGKLKPI